MAQEISFALSGTLVDDENWPHNDETKPVGGRATTTLTENGATIELLTLDDCAGAEVRLIVTVTAVLLGDNETVRVSTLLRLFEGTGCDTSDPDGPDVTIARNIASDSTSDFEAVHPGDGAGSFSGRVHIRNRKV